MKFEDYELIHKIDLLILKDRIKELEKKNKDLMDLVDVKRLWLIDKAENRINDILRVGHQLVERSGCTCDHHPMMPHFTCPRCQELKAQWRAVAGDPKE
jgi:hypothetical protein